MILVPATARLFSTQKAAILQSPRFRGDERERASQLNWEMRSSCRAWSGLICPLCSLSIGPRLAGAHVGCVAEGVGHEG
jgi:hypothetical protein